MNIYSYNEFTKELLIDTFRPFDWLDFTHPSIPLHSVIADIDLPKLKSKHAFVVVGERSDYTFRKGEVDITIEVFLVSKNLKQVEDHRVGDYYSKINGSKIEIKELGPLPENVTDQSKPDGYYKWDGKTWVEDIEAKNEAQKQKNIAFLSYEMRRASDAIEILDDAIEFEMATDEEVIQHKELRKYRLLLSRVPSQADYPLNPTWPECPDFFKQ